MAAKNARADGTKGEAPADDKIQAISVSAQKKPLFHYVSLAKKFLAKSEDVEIRGVGSAIARCVSVVEILKSDGLAAAVSIETGTTTNDKADDGKEDKERLKPTILVKLRRADDFVTKMEQLRVSRASDDANEKEADVGRGSRRRKTRDGPARGTSAALIASTTTIDHR